MIAAALALLSASAALPTSLPVDAATLAKLPAASATLTAHGQTHACTRVWLTDLAVAAGLPAGEAKYVVGKQMQRARAEPRALERPSFLERWARA